MLPGHPALLAVSDGGVHPDFWSKKDSTHAQIFDRHCRAAGQFNFDLRVLLVGWFPGMSSWPTEEAQRQRQSASQCQMIALPVPAFFFFSNVQPRTQNCN